VILDFPPELATASVEDVQSLQLPFERNSTQSTKKRRLTPQYGIASLPVTYAPYKAHVAKSKEIINSVHQGTCSVCAQTIHHDGSMYAVCPHPGCKSISHLSCLSNSFLDEESRLETKEGDRAMVPIQGTCNGCSETVMWVDIAKELTLRVRSMEDAKKLLKAPKTKATKKSNPRKAPKTSDSAGASGLVPSVIDADLDDDNGEPDIDDVVDDEDSIEEDDDFDVTKDDARFVMPRGINEDEWHVIDDSGDDDDLTSVASTANTSPGRPGRPGENKLHTSIEYGDWDDAVILD